MRNTPGKDSARSLFYKFAQQCFDANSRKSARALVLLGKERLEIPLLDSLKIPRNHVACVENKPEVYKDLHFWNFAQPPDQKVELFCGELTGYLESLIARDRSVEIFNLDINGTVKNQVMPQFENILKLARKQPTTVIGTYLSAGRDHGVLMESLEATVWWMMFDPSMKLVVEQLVHFFVSVGYSHQVAFNHTFRIMQWMYDIVRTLLKIKYPQRILIMDLKRVPKLLWLTAFGKKNNITWGKLVASIKDTKRIPSKIKTLSFDISPTKLQFVGYRNAQWTQLCQFMKLQRKSATLEEIIQTIVTSALRFRYASETGEIITMKKVKELHNYDNTLVMAKNSASTLKETVRKSIPRDHKVKLSPPKLAKSLNAKSAEEKVLHEQKPRLVLELPKIRLTNPPKPHTLWTKKTGFTDKAREVIREARAQGAVKTSQVAAFFPKSAPFSSINALFAISGRTK